MSCVAVGSEVDEEVVEVDEEVEEVEGGLRVTRES